MIMPVRVGQQRNILRKVEESGEGNRPSSFAWGLRGLRQIALRLLMCYCDL